MLWCYAIIIGKCSENKQIFITEVINFNSMNICNFPTQYGMDFAQGRRQRGGQWYPAHAFGICAPISGFAPWLLHTSNNVISKCGSPFWFLRPLLLILHRLPTKFIGGNSGSFM